MLDIPKTPDDTRQEQHRECAAANDSVQVIVADSKQHFESLVHSSYRGLSPSTKIALIVNLIPGYFNGVAQGISTFHGAAACGETELSFLCIMPLRQPTSHELRVIRFMIREGNGTINKTLAETLMVAAMDEGGMGSLLLHPTGEVDAKRVYGRTLFEFEFRDADGVPVVAALNVDQNDELFELDIWKANFEPLVRLPEVPE